MIVTQLPVGCGDVGLNLSPATGYLSPWAWAIGVLLCPLGEEWATATRISVLLHGAGQRSSFMTAGLPITSNVVSEQDFDPLSPCPGVESAIRWAESKLGDSERRYDQLYPWRFRSETV